MGPAIRRARPIWSSLMSRNNLIYLILGALVVIVVVLGYIVYDQSQQPDGVEIQIGPDGVSVEGQ